MIKEKTPIKFTLNGKEIEASPDSRLLDIIETDFKFRIYVLIQIIAQMETVAPVVEISGEKRSRHHVADDQRMVWKFTHSERAESARKMVLEMLGSDTKSDQAKEKP